MNHQLSALIVDDDQDAAAWLKYLLNTRFPELQVEVRLTPEPSAGFDIYLIDNDFHGSSLAADLVKQIRLLNSGALIVVFSACLDRKTLKTLLNLGCDGACDKSDVQDIDSLSQIIGVFLRKSREQTAARVGGGVLAAVRSIQELLRSWNQRLELGHALLDVPSTGAVQEGSIAASR